MQVPVMTGIHQLSLSALKDIAAAAGPCISILLPVEVFHNRWEVNPVRFKDAIHSVEQILSDKRVDPEQTRVLLEPVRGLATEVAQDAAATDGVAIFSSPEFFRVFSAPNLSELVSVADHFYLKPLLPLLSADPVFYVLALSQKHVRLLRCTDHSSEEVELPASVPKSMSEDAQTDQPDHVLNNRGAGGPSTGSMKGVVFTTSTDREDKDAYLLHFYKHLSEGVADLLKDKNDPLVIAGVDYEIAIFRRENRYPHLVENAVQGAADGLKGGELHKRALEALQPYLEEPFQKALARFEDHYKIGRASTRGQEIVKAAFEGRVSDLVLSESAQYMGNFDEATYRVRGHKQPLPGDEDLLNAAAVQTIRHSGEVFVVPAAKVPHGAPAVAVLRY